MLLTTDHITTVYNQGLKYLSNIVTNKFYRKQYGLQLSPTSADDKLLLLTYAVGFWSNKNGAVNPYTQTQLMNILNNISLTGRDVLTCYTCQKVDTGSGSASVPAPTPVDTLAIQWAYFSSDPGAPEDAALNLSLTISKGANYILKTSQIIDPSWIVIKEPVTEPVKVKWYNTALNNGDIPDQVWLDSIVSGDYRYYKTRKLTLLDPSSDTSLSKS